MAGCTVTPIKTAKACSGKCMGSGACGNNQPRVWVAAACDGMVSLFEKQSDGHIALLPQAQSAVFSSVQLFQEALANADHAHMLGQLIIVGAKSDIAWMHASLPAAIAHHVAAEIEYPLMSGWFKQPPQLASALEKVFAA